MSKLKITWLIGLMLIVCFLLTSSQLLSQSLTLSIPDTSAASNSLLKLPIRTTDVTGLGIMSLSITITFDPDVLDALGANSIGTISQSWGNPTTSDSTGQIKLAMIGFTPLAGEGILTYLFFEVTGTNDDTTIIRIKYVNINDGTIIADTVSGKFTTLEAEPSPHVKLAIPDSSGNTGSIIDLPIMTSDITGFNIDSLRLTLTFNKYVLEAQDIVTTGTLTENWKDTVETLMPGKISFFLKGIPALAESGTLCFVKLHLKGSPGMATPIHFQSTKFYNDTLRIATRDGKVAISGGMSSDVMVSIPDISADSASSVTIPVFISDVTNKAVFSVAMNLLFKCSVIQYQSYNTTNTLMAGWNSQVRFVPDVTGISCDTLKLGAFAASVLVGQGVLVEFNFNVVGKPGLQTGLNFDEIVLNEGSPSVTAFGGSFTVNYVIPVELSSFHALLKGKDVVLTWITASESDNYGFEIERSTNYEDWHSIGFVPGHGTTTVNHYYSYFDKNIDIGSYYYQLKQVDLNGSFKYSNVIEVDVGAPRQFSLGQNFPNPFNPTTVIPFDLPEKLSIKLTLYNLLGEAVQVISIGEFNPGHHEVSFNASRLAAGLYFYKLEAKDFVAMKKLLILK
jgi:hypothetical protein